MVEHLDSSELKKMDKSALKAHIRSLEAAGYSINYEQVKELAKDAEDPLKVLRKQIRQAYSNPPKSPVTFDSEKDIKRSAELEKLVKKAKNGELDLITIAQSLKLKGYTTLNKAALIAAIVKEENIKGEYKILAGAKSPKGSPKSVKAKSASPKISPRVSKAKSSSSAASSDAGASLEKKLIKAAKKGDLDSVKSLLAQGADPHVNNDEPVRMAVSNGHQEVVLFIMNYGKKAASKPSSPKSPKKPAKPVVVVKEDTEEIEEIEEVKVAAPKDYAKKLAKREITLLDPSRGKDLYQQHKKHSSTCSEDNGYACPDDLACDVSSNPGVCVDKESAAKNPKSIVINGHTIVGSKAAIKILKSKLASKEKMCGDMKYSDLMNVSLEKLKKGMLKKQGISMEGIDTHQKAVDLACEYSANNAKCSDENGYACPDGLACDVSSNPGICVSGEFASKEKNFIEYEGRKIVGSKAAIDILRKKLEGNPSGSSSPDKKRAKLIKKLMEITGKSEKKLSKKTTEELREMLESSEVSEVKKSKKIIKQDSEEAPEENDEVEERIASPVKKPKKEKKIEKLLTNLTSGKNSENDFSEAQLTILKCLGLAA